MSGVFSKIFVIMVVGFNGMSYCKENSISIYVNGRSDFVGIVLWVVYM